MVKLILKSPYIKSTGGASGYLKYIATRERVGGCARAQGQLVGAYLNSHKSVHCMKEKGVGGPSLCSLQVTCQSVHYSGDKIPTLCVQ